MENVVKLDVAPEFAVGRESEAMCLLARFFNGFANSTRLSILLLLADRGEMRVGDPGNRAGGAPAADLGPPPLPGPLWVRSGPPRRPAGVLLRRRR